MKKYITPEVEIKKFNTEDIMNASANITELKSSTEDDFNNSANQATIGYDALFTI